MEEQFRNNPQQQSITTITDTSSLLEKRDSPVVKIRRQFDQIRANFMLLLSPGDKQFKDLSKRVRLMLVSFVIPILFGATKFILGTAFDEMGWWVITSILLGAFTYAGVYWGVKAQVRKEAFYSIMTIPSLFVIAYSMFLFVLFEGPINRVYLWALFLVATTVFMIVLYIVTLAINILNVTLFYTIPLSRLGESVAYMVGVVTVFFTVYVATSLGIKYLLAGNYLFSTLVMIGSLLMLSGVTRYLWLYFVPYQKGIWAFVLATGAFLTLVLTGFSLVLPATWQVGVCVSMVAYLIFGQVIHKEQNTLKPMVIAEFVLIITALMIFILNI